MARSDSSYNRFCRLWARIEAALMRYCKVRWNGDGEDVLSETKELFYKKWVSGEFRYVTMKSAEWYGKTIAMKVARDVVGYSSICRERSLESMMERGWDVGCCPHKPLDERLEALSQNGSREVRLIIYHVLCGETITATCKLVGLSRYKFIKMALKESDK